jgi:hypothetical protein
MPARHGSKTSHANRYIGLGNNTMPDRLLARDLPREVERDSLREALIAALKELSEIGKEPVPDDTLYAAFVQVCARHHLHFFDGHDQKALLEECQHLQRDYDLDLSFALEDGWKATPPTRFRQALLRQISDTAAPFETQVAGTPCNGRAC